MFLLQVDLELVSLKSVDFVLNYIFIYSFLHKVTRIPSNKLPESGFGCLAIGLLGLH